MGKENRTWHRLGTFLQQLNSQGHHKPSIWPGGGGTYILVGATRNFCPHMQAKKGTRDQEYQSDRGGKTGNGTHNAVQQSAAPPEKATKPTTRQLLRIEAQHQYILHPCLDFVWQQMQLLQRAAWGVRDPQHTGGAHNQGVFHPRHLQMHHVGHTQWQPLFLQHGFSRSTIQREGEVQMAHAANLQNDRQRMLCTIHRPPLLPTGMANHKPEHPREYWGEAEGEGGEGEEGGPIADNKKMTNTTRGALGGEAGAGNGWINSTLR